MCSHKIESYFRSDESINCGNTSPFTHTHHAVNDAANSGGGGEIRLYVVDPGSGGSCGPGGGPGIGGEGPIE